MPCHSWSSNIVLASMNNSATVSQSKRLCNENTRDWWYHLLAIASNIKHPSRQFSDVFWTENFFSTYDYGGVEQTCLRAKSNKVWRTQHSESEANRIYSVPGKAFMWLLARLCLAHFICQTKPLNVPRRTSGRKRFQSQFMIMLRWRLEKTCKWNNTQFSNEWTENRILAKSSRVNWELELNWFSPFVC